MTILVGTSTSNTTTVTPPTHQAGDLIIICAGRASTTAPSLPSGWISILTKSGTTSSIRIGYKWATGTSDASGTWTNAALLTCHVYRPDTNYTLGIGPSASSSSTTGTVNYPALTLADNFSSNSWVLGFAFCTNNAQTISTAPSGMTNESSLVSGAASIAGHDTEGGVTTWSSTNVNVGTTGNSVSATLELMALPYAPQPSQVVQHIGGGSYGPSIGSPQSGNAFVCPLPNAVGAGNCLVLGFMYPNGTSITSVADNINGTWGAAVSHANAGSGNLDASVYVFPNAAAGVTRITITFGASVNGFQYTVSELTGIDTSPSAGSTNAAHQVGPTLTAGSFTPTNNDATGGNLIWNYFVVADASPAHTTINIRAGNNFTLLNADIGWINADGVYHGCQAYVQTTSAAINPTVTMIGDTDHFNTIAVALKLNSSQGVAGGPRRLVRVMHHTTDHFPASGGYLLQSPCYGNLRVITCDDPALNAQTITDSEGGTWTSAGSGFGIWYRANTTSNSNLSVLCVGGGADVRLSWRFFDVIGADSNPFDSGGSVASLQNVNGLSTFTSSPSPSPTSTSGITIAAIGLGQGPGLGVTAPSGAIFDLCTYTGETDFDYIEDADLAGHYYYTSSGAQTWTWSITSVGSNSTSGGIASFKWAPAASFTWLPMAWDDQPKPRPFTQHIEKGFFRYVAAATTPISGMAWQVPFDQPKVKLGGHLDQPVVPSAQLENWVMASSSDLEPWRPITARTPEGIAPPLHPIVATGTPISGMAWWTAFDQPKIKVNPADAIPYPFGFKATPISGMAWFLAFDQPKVTVNQASPIANPLGFTPTPISGMAWWIPFGQPTVKINQANPIAQPIGFKPTPISGIAWQVPFDQRSVKIRVDFGEKLQSSYLPSAPTPISGMAWFASFDQPKVKIGGVIDQPATPLAQLEGWVMASSSDPDPWRPITYRSLEGIAAPLHPIVTSGTPISGMAWQVQFEKPAKININPADAISYAFGFKPTPISGIAWQVPFDQKIVTVNQASPVANPLGFTPTPISGMAWWRAFDQPTIKINSADPLPYPFGFKPTPISGMAWWTPFDQSLLKVRVDFGDSARSLPVPSAPTPISGMAWFTPFDQPKVTIRLDAGIPYQPYVPPIPPPPFGWFYSFEQPKVRLQAADPIAFPFGFLPTPISGMAWQVPFGVSAPVLIQAAPTAIPLGFTPTPISGMAWHVAFEQPKVRINPADLLAYPFGFKPTPIAGMAWWAAFGNLLNRVSSQTEILLPVTIHPTPISGMAWQVPFDQPVVRVSNTSSIAFGTTPPPPPPPDTYAHDRPFHYNMGRLMGS